ncbi:hypothetical protein AVEN_149346-1 [Araneus ventricosus]|uniref:SWIM-type domain-containing protein n=1 Tax=Araneus ventricosus TaxID=182803 RepID=A0A4Y2R7B8_ARAVE|nr:hypothetical protein AVEN_149346-1 [Araneus ventricosus]
MKLERWHQQIKYEESGGTIMKRLDKSISIIMNSVAKKLLSRIMSSERGKLTHRMALIRKRQSTKMAEGYSFVQLNETSYVITKEVGPSIFTYNVEKTNTTCCCNIKCDQCSVCIHSMSCTCIDYCVKFVICKHIHYICLNAEKCIEFEETENSEEDALVIDINNHKEKQIYERESILPSVQYQDEDLNMKKGILL